MFWNFRGIVKSIPETHSNTPSTIETRWRQRNQPETQSISSRLTRWRLLAWGEASPVTKGDSLWFIIGCPSILWAPPPTPVLWKCAAHWMGGATVCEWSRTNYARVRTFAAISQAGMNVQTWNRQWIRRNFALQQSCCESINRIELGYKRHTSIMVVRGTFRFIWM